MFLQGGSFSTPASPSPPVKSCDPSGVRLRSTSSFASRWSLHIETGSLGSDLQCTPCTFFYLSTLISRRKFTILRHCSLRQTGTPIVRHETQTSDNSPRVKSWPPSVNAIEYPPLCIIVLHAANMPSQRLHRLPVPSSASSCQILSAALTREPKFGLLRCSVKLNSHTEILQLNRARVLITHTRIGRYELTYERVHSFDKPKRPTPLNSTHRYDYPGPGRDE